MDSILESTKNMLGIEAEYDAFDTEIISHINSVFMTLNQLGVGPKDTYSIEGYTETWDLFIGDQPEVKAVQSYIYAKVRMLFDPPTISAVMEALKMQIQEFEWRLIVQAETPPNAIPEPVPVVPEDEEDDW